MSSTKKLMHKIGLFVHNPNCYFCGRLMCLHEHKQYEPSPENTAVLYHLVSRTDANRTTPAHGELRSVLCCQRCANIQSHIKQGRVSVVKKWEASGTYPHWMGQEAYRKGEVKE